MKRRLKQIFTFAQTMLSRFSGDNAFKHGAAIAYYTVFSLPAIIIVVVRLAGVLVGEAQATDEILYQIEQYIGNESANQVRAAMTALGQQQSSLWATLLSIGTLLFGATGVFYTLQDSINTIWRIPSKLDQSGGILKVIMDRLLSFAMVVTMGFLLLVSMLLQAFISLLNKLVSSLKTELADFLSRNAPTWEKWLDQMDVVFWWAYLTDWVVGLLIITTVFCLLFRVLPTSRIAWRDAWVGGFFTAILFSIGRSGIGWYLAHSQITDTYGAAGSLVILLLWVYYSAQIMLLGAEFIYLYTYQNGREIEPAPFIVSILDKPLEVIKGWFGRGRSTAAYAIGEKLPVPAEMDEETLPSPPDTSGTA